MQFSIHMHESLTTIEEAHWNECARSGPYEYQPFVDYNFLKALELSACVGEGTGWSPMHVELKHRQETVGVVPMYLKNHSRGEYVFDYTWAEAFYRAGGTYYPKLQICVPFTPASGPRILTKQTKFREAVEAQLFHAIMDQTKILGASSAHLTFLEKKQWSQATHLGFLPRTDIQFHWKNNAYDSFEDFLAQLSAKKRKNIRRERRDVMEQRLHIEWLSGSDLQEHHWDVFYEFYLDTSSRKWGPPYLNREFFSQLNATMSKRILLILCRRGSKYVAGALNFIGDQTLYGRNWGCVEHYPFLHFEMCYYQAMEYAIRHNLQTVEAGAQGGHKFARGYQAEPTFSGHYIANERFRDAVAHFLEEENKFVNRDLVYLATQSPFKENSTATPAKLKKQSDHEL